ncbi:hypothetical protein [Planomonospora algeriensis]
MTGFEISSGAVGQEGARVSARGADYDAAVQRLRERGYGASSWGDDGLFGMIVAAYAECAQVSLEALAGLSGEIGGTGEGLGNVARNTRDTENATAGNLGGTAWA